MAPTLNLLRRLADHGVESVLIGGLAAAAYGGSIVTDDVDVCTNFTLENVSRLLRALEGLHPRQRMRPDRPPLSEDPATYVGWKNLYIVTDEGQLDLLGSVVGVGDYPVLSRNALSLDLGGFHFQVMGIEDLIHSKRTLGRPKDLRAADELQLVLQNMSKR